MREVQGIIAVEIVDHQVIRRRIEILQGFGAVVVIAADQDQRVRRNRPDPPDTVLHHPVPGRDIFPVRYLVQQLKGNLPRFAEGPGQLFP